MLSVYMWGYFRPTYIRHNNISVPAGSRRYNFPADFIVLDMDEDREIPLILGRYFLSTGKTLIDVQKGKLTLRVQDDEVTFNVFEVT